MLVMLHELAGALWLRLLAPCVPHTSTVCAAEAAAGRTTDQHMAHTAAGTIA